ncbi:hypothetical protein P7K49_037241 [Saguinus oedipus]|uniref:Uncharacterized protein n=1 Tax=Saguinus oedipus TaxID=9490 RepID=A0ABQ9THH9_SAGOE|nr:hypothetical protein P7K49_037241 [Saguinus oedipus]
MPWRVVISGLHESAGLSIIHRARPLCPRAAGGRVSRAPRSLSPGERSPAASGPPSSPSVTPELRLRDSPFILNSQRQRPADGAAGRGLGRPQRTGPGERPRRAGRAGGGGALGGPGRVGAGMEGAEGRGAGKGRVREREGAREERRRRGSSDALPRGRSPRGAAEAPTRGRPSVRRPAPPGNDEEEQFRQTGECARPPCGRCRLRAPTSRCLSAPRRPGSPPAGPRPRPGSPIPSASAAALDAWPG